jgi:hypothetical protein
VIYWWDPFKDFTSFQILTTFTNWAVWTAQEFVLKHRTFRSFCRTPRTANQYSGWLSCPSLYPGGPRLKSYLVHPTNVTDIVVFLSFSTKFSDCFKIGHDLSLSRHFQFVIRLVNCTWRMTGKCKAVNTQSHKYESPKVPFQNYYGNYYKTHS